MHPQTFMCCALLAASGWATNPFGSPQFDSRALRVPKPGKSDGSDDNDSPSEPLVPGVPEPDSDDGDTEDDTGILGPQDDDQTERIEFADDGTATFKQEPSPTTSIVRLASPTVEGNATEEDAEDAAHGMDARVGLVLGVTGLGSLMLLLG
jgi:hypothetical protein